MTLITNLPQTESTNTYLHQLAINNKLEELTIITTDWQTAGRGQKGNTWESEAKKNLSFSILTYPKHIEAHEQFVLSQLISLAVKTSLDKYTADVSIKWPNDIYWQNKKIAGILIENDLCESSIAQSILGVGININQENFENGAPNPISLKLITGIEYDRASILNEIISNFECYTNSQKWVK